MDIVKTAKIATSVVSVLAVIFGGMYFLEDRYLNVVDAKTMLAQIEKVSVQTFQQQQQYIDSQQKKVDLELLDLWRERLRDVERLFDKNRLSQHLKNQLDWIKNKIKRIEDRLYQ